MSGRKILNERQVIVVDGRPALITRIGDDGPLVDKRADKSTIYYSFIKPDGTLGAGESHISPWQADKVGVVDYAKVSTVVDLPPNWKEAVSKYDIERKSNLENEPERHPSYGVIEVSRYSGDSSLFASPFRHQHFMGIRISRATMTRSLSYDRTSTAGEPSLLHISMSEAQWAKMISSAGIGGGTPCTITRIGSEQMPECPQQKDVEKFHTDIKASMDRANKKLTEALKMADDLLNSKTATKKEREALRDALFHAQKEMTDSVPFVATQMRERMEHIVAEGKTEIEAFAHQTLIKTGLDKLMKEGQPAPIDLHLPDGEDIE